MSENLNLQERMDMIIPSDVPDSDMACGGRLAALDNHLRRLTGPGNSRAGRCEVCTVSDLCLLALARGTGEGKSSPKID